MPKEFRPAEELAQVPPNHFVPVAARTIQKLDYSGKLTDDGAVLRLVALGKPTRCPRDAQETAEALSAANPGTRAVIYGAGRMAKRVATGMGFVAQESRGTQKDAPRRTVSGRNGLPLYLLRAEA